MGHNISREKSAEFDLENGGNTSEEDTRSELDSAESRSSYVLSRVWSGLFCSDKSNQTDCTADSYDCLEKSNGVVEGNVLVSTERSLDRDEIQDNKKPNYNVESSDNISRAKNNNKKQKKGKTNSRKPPRPPRGPALDAADQRLVKEIAELARKKRARMEHTKALKNKKTARASFSSTSLSAVIITIFFLLVIFFQGMSCRRSAELRLLKSPEPVFDGGEGLISIQHCKNSTSR